MKRIVPVYMFLAIASFTLAQDGSTTSRRAEFDRVLTMLGEPQKRNSHIQNPGWSNPETRKGLLRIVQKSPGTDEALTAELWLAIIDGEAANSNPSEKDARDTRLTLSRHLAQIRHTHPTSWQAKAARFERALLLYSAKEWSSFRDETSGILSNIESLATESSRDFVFYIQQRRLESNEIEPELRFLLVGAAAREGRLDEAITQAEELQEKFPDWSNRRKVAGEISLFKQGINPLRGR